MPFTVEQFLSVFQNYNQSVWPLQMAFYLLALLAMAAGRWNTVAGHKLISTILAFFWGWMGIVYHWRFFAAINPAARIFGGFFLLQCIFFVWHGMVRSRLTFRFQPGPRGFTGAVLMAYALVVYPLTGMIAGHVYPAAPTFGLPCPTTIFTFGMLLWSVRRPPIYGWTVPLLWSLIGFTAALKMGIWEDIALPVAGSLTAILLLRRNRPSVGP